jgi:excisionase family DNA binding protein
MSSSEATVNDVMTVQEAAEFLRIGINQVYEAVNRGDLPHLRIGKTIRLLKSAVVRCLGGSCETTSNKG